jgi:hypothetical protein
MQSESFVSTLIYNHVKKITAMRGFFVKCTISKLLFSWTQKCRIYSSAEKFFPEKNIVNILGLLPVFFPHSQASQL